MKSTRRVWGPPVTARKHSVSHERFDTARRFRFVRARACIIGGIAVLVLAGCGVQGPVIDLESPAELHDSARFRAALLESPDLDAAPIRLESTERRVTLRGFVETEAERNGVLATARELFGDREIVDRIELR